MRGESDVEDGRKWEKGGVGLKETVGGTESETKLNCHSAEARR